MMAPPKLTRYDVCTEQMLTDHVSVHFLQDILNFGVGLCGVGCVGCRVLANTAENLPVSHNLMFAGILLQLHTSLSFPCYFTCSL